MGDSSRSKNISRGMVNMLSSKERILEVLEKVSNGICDDCLSRESQVFPRQQVNSICRELSNAGKIERKKASCSICSKSKLLNSLVIKEGKSILEEGSEHKLSGRIEEWLDSVRREIIKIFNKVDPKRRVLPDKKETFSERLFRLQKERKVPAIISAEIRLINTFRNAVVYEEYELEPRELSLLKIAWELIKSWQADSINP